MIAALRDELNPGLDVHNAARLAWAAVQGLLVLQPNLERMAGLLDQPLLDPDALAAVFARLLVDGFRAG